LRFPPASGKRLRIGIESDNIGVRMKALDQHDQAAGAAADVEHTVTWANRRLIEEGMPGRLGTDQPYERVVERQEPGVARRGEIRPAWFRHCFDSFGALSADWPSVTLAIIHPTQPITTVVTAG
jgi:hypothetical protein